MLRGCLPVLGVSGLKSFYPEGAWFESSQGLSPKVTLLNVVLKRDYSHFERFRADDSVG